MLIARLLARYLSAGQSSACVCVLHDMSINDIPAIAYVCMYLHTTHINYFNVNFLCVPPERVDPFIRWSPRRWNLLAGHEQVLVVHVRLWHCAWTENES